MFSIYELTAYLIHVIQTKNHDRYNIIHKCCFYVEYISIKEIL